MEGDLQLDLLPGFKGLIQVAAGDEDHGSGTGLGGEGGVGGGRGSLVHHGLGDGELQGLIGAGVAGGAHLELQALAHPLVGQAGKPDGIDQRSGVRGGLFHREGAAGEAVLQLGDVQGCGIAGAGAVAGILDGHGDIDRAALVDAAHRAARGVGDGVAGDVQVAASLGGKDRRQRRRQHGQQQEQRNAGAEYFMLHGVISPLD